MQDVLSFLAPDLVANYIAIGAIILTSVVMGQRWKQDKDPLTGGIFFAFLLQSIGLIGSLVSEIYARIFIDIALREFFSIVFTLAFIVSFIPFAYFYSGLFLTRNKWYLPFISFIGGAGVILTAKAESYYLPPIEVYMILVLLIFLVYIPLFISCVRMAPLASRRVTRIKFWLVGMSAFVYVLSYIIVVIPDLLAASAVVGNLSYALAGILIAVSYVLTYMGWVMPSWLRIRLSVKTTPSTALDGHR